MNFLVLSRQRYIDPTEIAAIDDFGGTTFSDEAGHYRWVAILKNGHRLNLTDEDYDVLKNAHDEIIRAWYLNRDKEKRRGY